MCSGGRLLADFTAGTRERPDVPDIVAAGLTVTVDGEWVIWARKVAMPAGSLFRPLTSGTPYPADAVAACARGESHSAPHLGCSCGFHAVSSNPTELLRPGSLQLHVALSGRTLAFDWHGGRVLYRAERQTVVRIETDAPARTRRRPDPSGQLSRRESPTPTGEGPIRLEIPRSAPHCVRLQDEAGYCALVTATRRQVRSGLVTA